MSAKTRVGTNGIIGAWTKRTGHRGLLRGGLPLVAAVLLVSCSSSDPQVAFTGGTTTTATSTTTTTIPVPAGIEVAAGLNDPRDASIVVTEFMPAEVTVAVGTPVEWVWRGAEAHTVAFLPPGREPYPGGAEDPSLFGPAPPSGPIDGQQLVSSGLRMEPEKFALSFTTAGSYPYYCVIHLGMNGTVNVIAEPAGADTPASVFERRRAEQADWLAEGRSAKRQFASRAAESRENDDGSSTFDIAMGFTTEHTDVLAFSPSPAEVRAGDSIRFVNNSRAPHTASFFGEGAESLSDPNDPRTARPAPGPSPQKLADTGFSNTGLLPSALPERAPPPEAARSFTFEVPEDGTYAYVCILHAPSGMVGSVTAT